MNPTMDRQVGLEQTTLDNTHGQDATVVTAQSALGAPESPIGLDAPEGAETPAPKQDAKPLARPDQVMVIEEHIEAVRAMQATGYVKGKALEEFLATGNATVLTEAIATRIINHLNPKPEPEQDPAATLGGDAVSPAAAPSMDHESDEDARRVENNWAGQPATDGMVREMNRVMSLRGEAVQAVIASWQQAGVEVKMPSTEVTAATKGDFKDLKAAEQAGNIASNAARRLSEWESIRANKDGVPHDPAQTVGQYTTDRVKAKLADLDAVAPSIKDAILSDTAVIALADAATAKNRSILEAIEKSPDGYKPSRFDYAPNLARAIQFAVASNPGLEPEAVKESIKLAYSAGTVGVLYRLADALGVKEVAKVKVTEKKSEGRSQGGSKGPKDPDWASKPIDKRDAEKLVAALASKGSAGLPDWAKQRLGEDLDKVTAQTLSERVSRLSQGDFAKLRKAGVVENAQTGTGTKKPFDPSEAASSKTVEKVKASTTSLDKVGAELAAKVTQIRAGEAIGLTKGEVADLRKAQVIE